MNSSRTTVPHPVVSAILRKQKIARLTMDLHESQWLVIYYLGQGDSELANDWTRIAEDTQAQIDALAL